MARTRTEAIAVRPTNGVYTALTGAACIAVLVALVVLWLSWESVSAGDDKLFFGMF